MLVRLLQSRNTQFSMYVMLSGIVTLVMLLHPSNVKCTMHVIPSCITAALTYGLYLYFPYQFLIPGSELSVSVPSASSTKPVPEMILSSACTSMPSACNAFCRGAAISPCSTPLPLMVSPSPSSVGAAGSCSDPPSDSSVSGLSADSPVLSVSPLLPGFSESASVPSLPVSLPSVSVPVSSPSDSAPVSSSVTVFPLTLSCAGV